MITFCTIYNFKGCRFLALKYASLLHVSQQEVKFYIVWLPECKKTEKFTLKNSLQFHRSEQQTYLYNLHLRNNITPKYN